MQYLHGLEQARPLEAEGPSREMTRQSDREGAPDQNKRAVAMAAMPSPRPVRPRPSVVVAERLTGAPTASLITSSASARRDPILGRSPISWTEMLAMPNPAALIRAAVSARKAAPGASDHCGSVVP